MNSCVYRGRVRHRRMSPAPHEFQYGMFMLYLDLGELPGVFDGRWLWSARRPSIAWFRRKDYLGDPAVPLERAVRDLVEARSGRRPQGPIRLLTHLRYFGYIQNPVSFYYCFDESGTAIETIVAEITNTPWGERHAYVLPGTPGSSRHRVQHAKHFHVSPFMPMDHAYEWTFSTPDRGLLVHMKNLEQGQSIFDATLALRRKPLNAVTLSSCLLDYPWMTAAVAASIYWQALRLMFKGVPFHPHPKRGSRVPAAPAR